MVLAIDIGNTNVVIGLSDGDRWVHHWRLITTTDQDALLFYEMQLTNHLFEERIAAEQIRQAILSSVVPALTELFVHLVAHLFKREALVVAPPIYPKLQMQIDRPDEIGTDLLANAVAAHHMFSRDCIVVDFGTALTFTSVTAAGHILGVSIAPGLKTAISALYSKTAQLPEVPLVMPDSVIGKNTVHAIQSGVLIGYVGLVKHMLHAIRAELGEHYIAIATGGLSSILLPLRDEFEAVDPFLTLNGLKIIGEFVEGEGE